MNWVTFLSKFFSRSFFSINLKTALLGIFLLSKLS